MRKSKTSKGFWVVHLKIDTVEVRGSSPYVTGTILPLHFQGAITIPRDFFECLRMLIIPRNSLKFRFLVDSNPTLSATHNS